VLHQRVADQLRRAIVGGALPPGTWLREVEIAEQLGISRAPLREALRTLELEGLVAAFPYRGVRVIGIDLAEAIELFMPLRQAVESYAVRVLLGETPSWTADESTRQPRLEATVAAMDATIVRGRECLARGDRPGSADADTAFHRLLCCESGHPMTAQLWRLIEPRIAALFRARLLLPDGGWNFAAHDHIVAALRARDAARADELIRQHIQGGMPAALEALSQAGAVPQPRVTRDRARPGQPDP
jgi:DNA-binding GntR family transcriptional regulator